MIDCQIFIHRFIENRSNSAFESTESEIQNDFDTECQNEETICETDIDFTCATQKLPTDLVDIDCCRFFCFVKLGVLAKQLLIDKCSVCSKCVTGILYVQCPDCDFISKVYLGKTHRKGK